MLEPIGKIWHEINIPEKRRPAIKPAPSGRTKLQTVMLVEDKLSAYFVLTDDYICPTESGYIKVGQVI